MAYPRTATRNGAAQSALALLALIVLSGCSGPASTGQAGPVAQQRGVSGSSYISKTQPALAQSPSDSAALAKQASVSRAATATTASGALFAKPTKAALAAGQSKFVGTGLYTSDGMYYVTKNVRDAVVGTEPISLGTVTLDDIVKNCGLGNVSIPIFCNPVTQYVARLAGKPQSRAIATVNVYRVGTGLVILLD